MNYQNDLFDQTDEKLRIIAKRLDDELSDLQAQGILTLLDKQKMIADAQTSAKALFDALNNTSYPLDMQRELVKRLIDQFEDSTNNILRQAKLRRYSRSRLIERFTAIEDHILHEYRNLSERSVTKAKSEFRKLQNTFIARIELLINRGRANEKNIEPLFEQYRNDVIAIVMSYLPRIQEVVEETRPGEKPKPITTHRPTARPTSVESPRKGYVKFVEDNSQKKTPLTENHSKTESENRISGIKAALLIAFVLFCSLFLLFYKSIFFLFRFLFR